MIANNYLNKKIMILGASILQLPAIVKAKELGITVLAVDQDENAIGMKYADIPLTISTLDIPRVLKEATKHKIHGIMTLASDMPVRTVARVAQGLQLPGLSIETSFNATDKAMMREALKKQGVPIPKFYYTNNYQNYLKMISNFNEKFIVKPVDNSGSRGVYLVKNKSDIEKAYNYSKNSSRNGVIIMEEYMDGDEVCVESVTINGESHIIAITDKITTGTPYFVEMGHTQPSAHSEKIKTKIEKITKKAIKAVGIVNGVSNTEVKILKDEVKIVELGARLSGDNITTHLVPLSTGVDMVKAAIDCALGITPCIDKKIHKSSAIRYFKTREGIIRSIKGIEKARLIDGIIEIKLLKNQGDKIEEIKNSNCRIGFIIAQGENCDEAVNNCEKAIQTIKIEIDKDI